ncbi:18171_t:CDS:2, partial [Racocetra persica]
TSIKAKRLSRRIPSIDENYNVYGRDSIISHTRRRNKCTLDYLPRNDFDRQIPSIDENVDKTK